MKKLIFIVIIGAIGWQLYEKYQIKMAEADIFSLSNSRKEYSVSNFKCDGRVHCSQMNSCEESTFFLKNCPGVKMDGDNDGIPCEKQWCN